MTIDGVPECSETPTHSRRKRQHKATADDLDLSESVELVTLAVKERAARGVAICYVFQHLTESKPL